MGLSSVLLKGDKTMTMEIFRRAGDEAMEIFMAKYLLLSKIVGSKAHNYKQLAMKQTHLHLQQAPLLPFFFGLELEAIMSF